MFNPKIVRAERQSKIPFSEVSIGLTDICLSPFDRDIILPTRSHRYLTVLITARCCGSALSWIGAEAVKGDFESGMRCFDTIMFVLRVILNYIYPLNLQKYTDENKAGESSENLVPYMVKDYIDQHYAEKYKTGDDCSRSVFQYALHLSMSLKTSSGWRPYSI